MQNNLTCYCGHSITGEAYSEIKKYYIDLITILRESGYTVLCPMFSKPLVNVKKFKATGYPDAVSTNHAIVQRDLWMVHQADIVYINFENTTRVSIGMTSELAVAHAENKHTVITLPDDNIHEHAFILEMADIIFGSHNATIDYLINLQKGEICHLPQTGE